MNNDDLFNLALATVIGIILLCTILFARDCVTQENFSRQCINACYGRGVIAMTTDKCLCK